jgi:hypothetical protein
MEQRRSVNVNVRLVLLIALVVALAIVLISLAPASQAGNASRVANGARLIRANNPGGGGLPWGLAGLLGLTGLLPWLRRLNSR